MHWEMRTGQGWMKGVKEEGLVKAKVHQGPYTRLGCVCVCVCVCERAKEMKRQGEERETKTEIKRQREMHRENIDVFT